MITVDDLRQSWALLATRPPDPDRLVVRELAGLDLLAGPPMIALDPQGQRHILLPIPPGTSVREDLSSGGVHVRAHSLFDADRRRYFVDVICRKPHLYELYDIIGTEILTELGVNSVQPDRVCHTVLERWRELLESEASTLPGLDVLTGLFGELWHLREIVRRSPEAWRCWRGPLRERHDFARGLVALEVKATRTRQGRLVDIHGHDQLEPPSGGQLYLAFLRLEQVMDTGQSIPDLVSDILEGGVDRPGLLGLLTANGLGPDVLPLSQTIRFQLREQHIYRVELGFPRIVTASFIGGVLPAGIRSLQYQIDLSSEPPVPLTEELVSGIYAALAGVAAI